MSAYMIDRDHVVALVKASTTRRFNPHGGTIRWWHNDKSHAIEAGDTARALEVGQMLWDENRKSIDSRYPDCKGKTEKVPGMIGEDYKLAVQDFYGVPKSVKPVELLSSINCLEYQSCEHDEWEQSEAFAFLQSLKESAIRALPGYDKANWGTPGSSPEEG